MKHEIQNIKNNRFSTRSFGKKIIIDELKKRGFDIDFQNRILILDNRLKVDFKTCNLDNDWAKKDNCVGGFDRINPDRFDYLICVSFGNNHEGIRYLIFSKKETGEFPDIFWKDKNFLGLKNLTLIRGDEESERIIKSNENRWDKIK